MKDDLFEIGFFSFLFILLISLSLYIGYEVRGDINNTSMDNIVIIKKCGKVVSYE